MMREGWPLTKVKQEEVDEELSGLKGNDVTRRELTGSLVTRPSLNFLSCAVPQHCFWISVCTSADGSEQKCLFWDSGWKKRLLGISLAFPLAASPRLYIGPLLLDASV